uniref:Putative secreted peptide n=1 Tax=Anopheles braziliensis TaxID=58242 RepID=A0A2M3ZX77_9DIPT
MPSVSDHGKTKNTCARSRLLFLRVTLVLRALGVPCCFHSRRRFQTSCLRNRVRTHTACTHIHFLLRLR